jgi:hypothetical protein
MQVKDVYTWQATYRDGTSINEYDDARPDGRGWAEREAKEVATITLARVSDGTAVQSIDVPEGAEPVFFRRRSLTFGPTDESARKGTLAHCIGWKRNDEAVYLFVFDDGSTLRTPDLQAV